ncbi:hypothetical protein P154DRAFT_518533 [Amniculicola lignicola CBS 123094]|uniref:Acid protease n=1 Tax=Amniculicola lignicola CBS 123094 TaxID=1392246 RepID=A0A6A5WZ09_9PLEO|nr:hypothetical protein P154DRAFT_518533 [Amniculicola lignicola CBS 123094]
MISINLLLLSYLSLLHTGFVDAFFEVPWSESTYGPDGPWHAVKIRVGGNDTETRIESQEGANIDVYPGGQFETWSIPTVACKEYSNSLCGAGGLYDPEEQYDGILYSPNKADDSYGFSVEGADIFGRGLTIAGRTVWNASQISTPLANITYPSGRVGGVVLGRLSLGANDPEKGAQLSQVFTQSDITLGNITVNIFPAKLYQDKEIQSYSYGLHLGSTTFNYPGSLIFGGYNKARVIGHVTTFEDPQIHKLLDIGIGVEEGGSPFDFSSQQGLLLNDTTTPTSIDVNIDPLTPYLSLPGKTCEKIASFLPVNFDQDTKFYHWDVNDPKFEQIVSSPAYLSFTFPPGTGDSANVTIKVPFALLNLTLDRPITDKPTAYFPCHPYTPDPADEFSKPRLGRAFLQAAFIGRNWKSRTTWLGQAPGPGSNGVVGLGEMKTEIQENDSTIESLDEDGSKKLFAMSWKGHWTAAADKPKTSDGPSNTNQGKESSTAAAASKGMSTGAKAGIGVAVPLAAIALVGVGFLLFRRRQKKRDQANAAPTVLSEMGSQQQYLPVDSHSPSHPPSHHQKPYQDYYAHKADSSPMNSTLNSSLPPQELHTESEPQEMPDRGDPRMR